MTKTRLGVIELEWTCPHCDTNNPGPRGFCSACGAPQPADIEFHQPPAPELLTDEDAIRRAQAGPDLICPYCQARNPGQAGFCGACGAELGEAAERSSGQVVGTFRREHQLEIPCPACGTLNAPSDHNCRGCGAPLPREKKPEKPGPVPPRSRKLAPGVLIGAALACVAIAAAAVAWLSRTEPTLGRVQSVEWRRTISVEARVPTERQDWREQIPTGAEVLSCEERLQETRDQPAPGALEVCGTPYTIDTGSGYGEVVQDCIYEIYADFCRYTIMDWGVVEQVSASGTDLSPYWPTVTLTADQREGAGEEAYQVHFATDEGDRTYTPQEESEFRQFTPGSSWVLDINPLGGVVSVSPAP